MNKERLIAFTDAILAIIMTILVLELAKPASPTVSAFWALRTSFFSYALSFFWLGSLWVGLNQIWDKVEQIDNAVIWWNLLLLFLASLIPYATSLCSEYFESKVIQAFYGIVVISMTVCNYFLHLALDKPNRNTPILLEATKTYRQMLVPDIGIKIVGLLLAVIVYPPLMMYAVLLASAYILTMKHRADVRHKRAQK
ncbi:DUF1211 domain-containing membrane protein [Lactobacillus nasalidis]|uniref:DUF1211 domain-containing membrane protein n=1 Tax=Lactobacillus nasalidis TaxID=2797258 RepID=A0ABQ3W944_9LACO|nr:TMEM175 family protein [Lactobacillus nasalidis]GHV97783.1 DUF1211 domain-containing membrane protein [Lactobacillus nasalidis]GHV99460.1 DUF1211 domain-containing membrane protein [Lactobacillus nasalidis]GHW01945.1 DUF1211 domain-containing membrane protein [Lactobacillus nasalidis]